MKERQLLQLFKNLSELIDELELKSSSDSIIVDNLRTALAVIDYLLTTD